MNVNKKNSLLIILIFILNLFIINVHAFKVTTGSIVVTGVGTSVTQAPYKYYDGSLVYCTQFDRVIPNTCQGIPQTLSDEILAGVDVIVNADINYVCKELLLTKFLSNKYNSTGRRDFTIYSEPIEQMVNGKVTKARWNYSCMNAQEIYNAAIAKYDEIVALKASTPLLSPGSLNFSYNSSSQNYEATVSISDNSEVYNYDYECAVDNGASISYNGNNVTVSVSRDKSGETITLTCNLKTNINAHTYYYCGTNSGGKALQDIITSTATSKKIISQPATATGSFADKGSIQLEKVNSNGQKVLSKDISLNIYSDNTCSTFVKTVSTNTGGDGIFEIDDLQPNQNYYAIETYIGDDKYSLSRECVHIGYVNPGTTNEPIKYVNKTQCEVDFEKDSSIANRLVLYKTYGFRNLLNFNKTNSSEACSTYTPDYKKSESCLFVDQVSEETENKFNHMDLSDYNDVLTSEDSISFCLTDLELRPKITYDSNILVKAGNMVINESEDFSLIETKIKRTCYIHKNDYDKFFGKGMEKNISDNYIPDIVLDEKELPKDIIGRITNTWFRPSTMSNPSEFFYKVITEATIEYKPNAVYAEKITGKQSDFCFDSDGNLKYSCRLLGYGVASKFSDGKLTEPSFNFSVKPGTGTIFSFNENNTCKYKVEPEVITYDDNTKGKLELEFRTIDTNNPFNRETKSNWGDGSNKSKDNNIVKENITNSDVNNSYNRTGGGSLYQTGTTGKIILTSELVQQIREYNKENPYNDYTVYTRKEDGEVKTSTAFFDYIGLTKVQ